MHDLQNVPTLHLHALVSRPRHHLAIALHCNGTIRQAKVPNQAEDSQSRRHVMDFSVDGQLHATYVAASLLGCQ